MVTKSSYKKIFLCLTIFYFISAFNAWAINVETAQGSAPPHPDKGAYYRVWCNGGSWHIRWSSRSVHHNFSGRVWAPEGMVFLDKRVKTEPNDRIYVEGKGINFQAGAKTGDDGFDFRWDGPYLWLDLVIDGNALLDRIMVGPNGIHPDNMPFIMNRHIRRGPRPRGEWVPGHFNPRGHWIPGHWR